MPEQVHAPEVELIERVQRNVAACEKLLGKLSDQDVLWIYQAVAKLMRAEGKLQ